MSVGRLKVSGNFLFTSMTELEFVASRSDHGKIFKCAADHEAMEDKIVTISLNVQSK